MSFQKRNTFGAWWLASACQYPGCNDYSCSCSSSSSNCINGFWTGFSECNNGVWDAACYSGTCRYGHFGTWQWDWCRAPVPTVCEPGKYRDSGTNCLDCPAGSHSESGSTVVTDCKCTAGMGGPDGGPCEPCPVGTFSNANTTNTTKTSTSCTPCASGWTTTGEGSTMCTIYSSCDHTTNTIYINTTIEVEKIIEVGIRLVLFENLHVLVLAMHLKY